jgi:hypothetical protein
MKGHVLSQTIFRISLYPTKVISEFSSPKGRSQPRHFAVSSAPRIGSYRSPLKAEPVVKSQ